MKKAGYIALFWMIVLGITGCSAVNDEEALKVEETEAMTQAGNLHSYLGKDPFSSEDDFWDYIDEAYPVTPFQDIRDRKVALTDVVVDAVVAVSEEVTNKSYENKYELTLLYEMEDKSHLAFKEEVNILDNPAGFFVYGAETVRSLEKDDIIRICFRALNGDAVDDNHIIAIKKIGHQDGIVDEILNKETSHATTEKTEIVTGTSSSEVPVSKDDKQRIAGYVRSHINSEYTMTSIDRITVNDDLGTEQEDDYIVLAYLTWNQKNSAKTSTEVLEMYSNDLAATLAEEQPQVQEVAIFWTVPYLNDGSAKWSFERKNDGMYLTDSNSDF